MSRTRRLSLRARMLVMLVGVTTILLLIMGTVSTYLLARRVDAQIAAINSNLTNWARTSAKLKPAQLVAQQSTGPDGYAVVLVPLRPQPHVIAVPSRNLSALTAQLTAAVETVVRQTTAAQLRSDAALATADGVVDHDHCVRFLCLGQDGKPFNLTDKLRAATLWAPPGQGTGRPVGYVVVVGQPISKDPDQVRGFILAELITGTALIALLALGGEWLIGQGLEPLDNMTRTANEITSRGDLTARMPDADDQTEVGKLGASINTMLDRIQQAFGSRLRSEQKVREFAADASHELRTPLTTIRGYAELYRQGALGPDQLPNAMRRIEQEAERMSALVAELLELARLDRTSSLDLTETDLAGVVRDAVADAIAVEPQRPVRAEAPPRLVAVVDEPRIRQVLANLLGNVRAHTPVSTPVAVRLGQITGGLLIEVADAGPGMSAEDAARAFDRFHRAAERPAWAGSATEQAARENHNQDGNELEPATLPGGLAAAFDRGRSGPSEAGQHGTGQHEAGQHGASQHGAGQYDASQHGGPAGQADPGLNGHRNGAAATGPARTERTSGSGLGLSIVQAIANAHGGRATLESRPGQGTKVRVWLPVRIVP
jgi:signal transduction histidine kinase